MNLDLILKGTIVPVTPISIIRHGAKPEHKGAPRLTVVKGGSVDEVPYIPGETLKGLLRNRSADIAFRITKEPMTLASYYGLAKGGIKGRDKEKLDDLLNTVKFRLSHPVLGLYGAAAPIWLGGSLAVGPAFPDDGDVATASASGGARRDDFKLDPSRLSMLTADGVEDYAIQTDGRKRRTATDMQVKKLGSDIGKLRKMKERSDEQEDKLVQLESERKFLSEELEELKKDPEIGSTVGRTLDDKRSIAPGSRLNQRIDLIRGTFDEAGLLLETLEDLRHLCRIGGMRSIGYGFFKAEWSIFVREDVDADFESAGTLSLSPNTFDLQSDHRLIKQAREAWAARRADPASLFVPTKDAVQ